MEKAGVVGLNPLPQEPGTSPSRTVVPNQRRSRDRSGCRLWLTDDVRASPGPVTGLVMPGKGLSQPVLAVPVDRGRLAARAVGAAHRRDRLAGPSPGDPNRLATAGEPLRPRAAAEPWVRWRSPRRAIPQPRAGESHGRRPGRRPSPPAW